MAVSLVAVVAAAVAGKRVATDRWRWRTRHNRTDDEAYSQNIFKPSYVMIYRIIQVVIVNGTYIHTLRLAKFCTVM